MIDAAAGNDSPLENQGGSGGGPEGPAILGELTTRGTRLIERAIAEEWDIPAEARKEIPKALVEVAKSSKTKGRNKIAAARTLGYLAGQNVAAGRLALDAQRGSRDEGYRPSTQVNVQVNAGESAGVAVELVDDWYGGHPTPESGKHGSNGHQNGDGSG